MKLNGLQIRKALELEVPIEQIFKIETQPEGDVASKELFDDNITNANEVENLDEIFGEEDFIYYRTQKKEHQINENLKAYTHHMYMSSLESESVHSNPGIINEKNLEIQFINTKELAYDEFMKNIMDAQMFMGKYERDIFKRRFSGIGSFHMEDYAEHHSLINYASLHFLDFFVKDSNIYTTITRLVTAGYEQDIIQQKEYLTKEQYDNMLETVQKHKKLINLGINVNLN